MYSLDLEALNCEQCPNGAVCYGNNTMVPKKGFWRPHMNTDLFFACPFKDACLGGEEENG